MNENFKRILDLARRTGDTMIVTDPDGQDAFVLMDLDQYEMLMDVDHAIDPYADGDWSDVDEMAGYDLIDEEQSDFVPVSEVIAEQAPDIWQTMQSAGEKGETWDVASMSESEILELEKQYRNFTNQGVEEAIEEEAKQTIPPVKKQQNEDDFGEEQFYLEPIE